MSTKTTKAISPKVLAGGIAGALVTIIVWVAGLFGLAVPTDVAAAAVVVVSVLAAWLKTDPLRGPPTS